ncbi:MAG: hypothetical protein EOP86_10565 [Verrucomicrobiaceae bacterium]|nr:MAG: hypothetical protein EOP86_10565 [Verrucomicrobiaceae bacterium]
MLFLTSSTVPADEKTGNVPAPAVAGVVRALSGAHSHNDYERDRPLREALDCGFMNVEADIYLVDGKLLVAHERKDVKPERTLRSLYLKPLAERAAQGGGSIYPGEGSVTLLIDIKGDASETWAVLRPELEEFHEILTECSDDRVQERAVTVVLSGSRPVEELSAATRRLAFLDGRPEDLEKNPPAALVPWISASWLSLFAWRGDGQFPEDQKNKLQAFTAKAHAQGRRVRFWGVYDEPSAWDILRSGGVDILGTDSPAKLREYLLKKELAPGQDPVLKAVVK